MEDLIIDYNEQMLDYYPEIIKAIREFRVLTETESVQVDEMHKKLTQLLDDAYIVTTSAERIAMWEKFLNIVPTAQGNLNYEDWLVSRRSSIIAKLYQSEKLNTKSISDIVSIFTGAASESWVLDGILYVKIYPPKDNKFFDLDKLTEALRSKCPAHLDLLVFVNYTSWGQVGSAYTWGDISTEFANWGEVMGDYPQVNIFEYVVDESGTFIADESNNRLFN